MKFLFLFLSFFLIAHPLFCATENSTKKSPYKKAIKDCTLIISASLKTAAGLVVIYSSLSLMNLIIDITARDIASLNEKIHGTGSSKASISRNSFWPIACASTGFSLALSMGLGIYIFSSAKNDLVTINENEKVSE